MKKLSYLDQGFLSLETKTHPLHVGGLQVYKIPSQSFPINSVKTLLWDFLVKRPPFNLKLRNRPLFPWRQDWEHAKSINQGYHFTDHDAAGQPIESIIEKIQNLHQERLDRRYPLWQVHFFTNIAGGRFAAYFKVHHACMDGMAGMRLLNTFLSPTPQKDPVFPAYQDTEKAEGLIGLVFKDFKELLFDKSGPLFELIKSYTLAAAQNKDPDKLKPLPFSAPPSLLNREFASKRRFEFLTVDLNPLKPVRKKYGATVNDLILVICASALRNYLLKRQELPAEPLIAAVPASVRSEKTAEGNQIGFLRVNLATNDASFENRIQKILESIKMAKTQLTSLSANALTTDAELIFMVGTIANATGAIKLLPPIHSLVISNVPISRKKLYLGQAQLEAQYPISALPPSQGLNISVLSYENQLDFGFLASGELLPDLDILRQEAHKAYSELIK